jgi:hypothetical protein
MSIFNDQPYYHETIRKLIVSFGQLFSGMQVVKRDGDGTKNQVIDVPIAYGPKNKWLGILNEDADRTNNVKIVLPRLAFEISGYQYDASRKVGAIGSHVVGTIGTQRAKLFNPIPYDVQINLYSLAKTQEESLQILEQILPYFAPSMTVNIEILPQFNVKKDIPIVLQSVSVSDSYEGDMSDFRVVEQTFSFVAQVDLFGPIIKSEKVIKEVNVDLNTQTPTSPGPKYKAEVNPRAANKNDNYNVSENWGFE